MTEQKHDDARGASHSDAELERFVAWWDEWTKDTPSWRAGRRRSAGWLIWKAATEAEREACIAATVAELVDFEATGSDEDEAYNTALWHAVEAMQRRSNKV